ncbi:MAG: hypothetical protein FJX76_06495 [Armatimonadetes bacterium]|nr:hypothetical protein [Armatimonadota bacterium]
MVTGIALGVAATSTGTIVGLPAAGVALGVAGVAQGIKYGYKFRKPLAGFASGAAQAVGRGLEGLRDGF